MSRCRTLPHAAARCRTLRESECSCHTTDTTGANCSILVSAKASYKWLQVASYKLELGLDSCSTCTVNISDGDLVGGSPQRCRASLRQPELLHLLPQLLSGIMVTRGNCGPSAVQVTCMHSCGSERLICARAKHPAVPGVCSCPRVTRNPALHRHVNGYRRVNR